MDHKLKSIANDGLCHAVMRQPWDKAPWAFRYAAMASCIKITFHDNSEVIRHGDTWYMSLIGNEAAAFVYKIREPQATLKTFCDRQGYRDA